MPFDPVGLPFLFGRHGHDDGQYRHEQHRDYYVVCVAPAVSVGEPCGNHVARLGYEQYEAVQDGHQESAHPLHAVLDVGSRDFGHGEHGQRVDARKVGCEGECAVEHDYHAHKTDQKACPEKHGYARGDGADVVERHKHSEAPQIRVPDTPCLQKLQHERHEQAHADACEETRELHVLRQKSERARHLTDIADIGTARECRRHEHEQQNQYAQRPGNPAVERRVAAKAAGRHYSGTFIFISHIIPAAIRRLSASSTVSANSIRTGTLCRIFTKLPAELSVGIME